MRNYVNVDYHSIMKYISMFGKKMVIFFLILFVMLFIIYYSFTSNKFVYIDRNRDLVYTESRHIPILFLEKKLVYLVRNYLAGSLDYKGRVPFSEKSVLKHISYNKHTKDLVLDWDMFFYKHMLDSQGQSDMEVFLETIKLNTDVKMIYFLIEGKQIPIFYNNLSLSEGYKIK